MECSFLESTPEILLIRQHDPTQQADFRCNREKVCNGRLQALAHGLVNWPPLQAEKESEMGSNKQNA